MAEPVGGPLERTAARPLPLVGRVEEMARLRQALAATTGGRGRAVAVSGEAGIGKTRLLEELAAEHPADRVLWGHCSALPGSPPYQPLADALRGYLLRLPPAQRAALVAPWRRWLADLLPELALEPEAAGDLAPTPLSASTVGQGQLFGAVAGLLAALAGPAEPAEGAPPAPLLLLLEDLQWADHAGVLLLAHLVRLLPGLPLLLVATYRPADLADDHPFALALEEFRRERRAEEITLPPLDAASAARHLANLLGGPPGSGLVAALAVAEGNPFFLEELAGHLAESGRLARGRDGHWTLVEDSAPAGGPPGAPERLLGELPRSVRAAISRRLDRLDEGTRATLRAAAVLGRRYSFDTLARVVAGAEGPAEPPIVARLHQQIDLARARGLLRDTPEEGESLRFAHELVREVLQQELNPARRRQLHALALAALTATEGESGEPGGMPARAALLAYHALAAGERAAAARYARQAAEQAERVFAWPEAARHWQAVARSADDPRAAAEAMERRAFVLAFAEGWEASAAAAHQALAAWERLGDPVGQRRLLFHLASVAAVGGAHERAESHLEALQALVAPGDLASAAVYHEIAALAALRRSLPEMAEHAARARALHAEGGDLIGFGTGCFLLGIARSRQGDLRGGEALLRESLAVHDRLMAAYWHGANDPEAVRQVPDRGATVWLALGWAGVAQSTLATNLALQGRLAEAMAAAETAARREQQVRTGYGYLLWARGLVLLYRGLLVEARTVAEEGLRRGEEHGDRRFVARNRWLLGRVRLQLGDLSGAQAELAQAWALVAGEGFVDESAEVALALAEAELARGEREAAAATLARAKAACAAYGCEVHAPARALLAARLARVVGEAGRARRTLEAAYGEAERMGAGWFAAWLRLELADLLRESGEHRRAGELLAEAEQAMAGMGAVAGMAAAASVRAALAAAPPSRTGRPALPGGLSPREAEVLRLVARGYSNAEIAAILVLSDRTVERHLTNILSKLGLATRAQAVAFAFRHGLAEG